GAQLVSRFAGSRPRCNPWPASGPTVARQAMAGTSRRRTTGMRSLRESVVVNEPTPRKSAALERRGAWWVVRTGAMPTPDHRWRDHESVDRSHGSAEQVLDLVHRRVRQISQLPRRTSLTLRLCG